VRAYRMFAPAFQNEIYLAKMPVILFFIERKKVKK
jgi:hypothetical protein